jgi:predicted DNA-binding transcriptional regulator YafY
LSRSERFYHIDQLLNTHKVMSRQALLDALDVSWATLKRDLAFLRDRFNAPIVFDREAGGYRFATPSAGPSYELPGLWFSGDEAYALLTMHQLLTNLEPGLLAPHVAPLVSRLESILGREHIEFAEVANRILLARIGKRKKSPTHFAAVSRSVLERQRLTVRHYSREKDSCSTRTLSPQRLLFYRNNWYLEAWCHTREALRRFSIDAFESVGLPGEPAFEVPVADLEREFGSAYGVYGGNASNIAVLRFSQAASRWVADEEWHPNQLGLLEADGRYILQVPYADATELKMDILRYGHHVEVVAPSSLRSDIMETLQLTSILYVPTDAL